ncbi:MAG: hypothetical protein COV35_07675 [Alphaproteobacteria bacterium CG11_big_fil_rev_8_21_14_0_20_39_49]|nr:MAG: hypothetical protein COV35_07675 [Alphaproteobacteria bacterium CG11_big_fil_rev_8_21_14_0_20_39_49]
MGLPGREYYYLGEVADRWSVSKLDIQYYIEKGLLDAGIWLRNAPVEFGYYENLGECGREKVPLNKKTVSGIYEILPKDCSMLFRRKEIMLYHLKNPKEDEYIAINNDNGFQVNLSDLVITEQACFEFEQKNGVVLKDNHGFIYNKNFEVVILNGIRFQLGSIQSNVVRLLHEASLTDDPWLYGHTTLCAAGSKGNGCMVDLFKNQPEWRKLIVSGKNGYYRLNIEPSHTSSHPSAA